jgi:hypothetical protein
MASAGYGKRGRCLGAAVAIAVVLVAAGGRGSAEAALSGCRSDPIVIVNGSAFDIISTLQTTSSAVQELDYTITVPTGSLLGGATLTIGLGFPEKVTYVTSATQRWGTITVAASVVTQQGVAPFGTTVQVTGTNLFALTTSASGLSNSIVTVQSTGLML